MYKKDFDIIVLLYIFYERNIFGERYDHPLYTDNNASEHDKRAIATTKVM